MDDLLQEFIAETRETLEALSGEIVAWEANPGDRDRLDAIFRFVHTVKGSCGFLDLPRLARLSHAAEDVLAAVRAGERAPDTGLVNAVLAIVDRIGELVEAIDAGAGLDDGGEDLLIAALEEGAATVASTPVAPALAQRTAGRSVRLNVDLLDRMMSGMSDMVLARNELARRLRDGGADPASEAALERLSLSVAEMRDTVTRTRMQKIESLFSALPRMVRDTAAELGKSVTLHIEGADVELDREMIEMMRDPLGHIVRNAIDHGIEAPAERRAAGKRENGRLSICARQSGNQIIIEIADDGRGIDIGRLTRKVAELGLRGEAELRDMGSRAALDLIFEPGLSTADTVTAISGRGVGMDVVRANVEQIGGRIDLDNTPGRGLRLTIRVPLTLSIISTIGIAVADHYFALPRQAIEEIVAVTGDAVRIDVLGDSSTVTVRERRMPLVHLAELIGAPHEHRRLTPILAIVGVSGGHFAIAIDAVLDTEELVIKPAAPAVMAGGIYAGQSLPDNGRPMLLLDCAGIAATAGLQFGREPEPEAIEQDADADRSAALLFDDLDGIRRAVPLAAVDRVEQVERDQVRHVGGRLRLADDGKVLPLVAMGDIGTSATLPVLRLDDGEREIAYVIAEAIDIVSHAGLAGGASVPGAVAGVVMIDDDPIELLDVHWLFATNAEAAMADARPLCLLEGADRDWMMTFLAPVIERAGYRAVLAVSGETAPECVIAGEDDAAVASATAPVIRLRRSATAVDDDASIYRYDRAALAAALAKVAGGRR